MQASHFARVADMALGQQLRIRGVGTPVRGMEGRRRPAQAVTERVAPSTATEDPLKRTAGIQVWWGVDLGVTALARYPRNGITGPKPDKALRDRLRRLPPSPARGACIRFANGTSTDRICVVRRAVRGRARRHWPTRPGRW